MYELIKQELSINHILSQVGNPYSTKTALNLFGDSLVYTVGRLGYNYFHVPVTLLVKDVISPSTDDSYDSLIFQLIYPDGTWLDDVINMECDVLFKSKEDLKLDTYEGIISSKIRATSHVYSYPSRTPHAIELVETKYEYLKPKIEKILEGRKLSKALTHMRSSISKLVNEQNVLADYYSSLPENLRDLLIKKS
jgi:hypothetical protein